MVKPEDKISPSVVKHICTSYQLNRIEKGMTNHFIKMYKDFYTNGKFKYFDSFMAYLHKVYYYSTDALELHNDFKIIIHTCNIAHNLCTHEDTVKIEELNLFISRNPNPSKHFRIGVQSLLYIISAHIHSTNELQLFVKISHLIELPILPKIIKDSFTKATLVSDQSVNLILDNVMITFISKPSYKELEDNIDTTTSKILVIQKIMSIEEITFFGRCYDIDKHRKKYHTPEDYIIKFIFSNAN